MINVIRTPDSLPSLETDTIKKYLLDLAIYQEDRKNNTEPAKPSNYRNWDVLEAFDNCFYSKCYLTEEKKFNSWKFDVDHFLPQNERPDLVYTWSNLFPCEHSTNLIKPRKSPFGGLLDPTNSKEDVETLIYYSADFQFDHISFTPVDSSNKKVVNTCALLDRVHNGHDEWSKKTTENLRFDIQTRADIILKEINLWRKAENGSAEKSEHETALKTYLSRKNSFTMLMRSMPTAQKFCKHLFD